MKSFYLYIFAAIVFFAAILLTDAIFWADTSDYVDSAIAFQEGGNYNFWEFGHLFWRPLGWVVWSQLFQSGYIGNWRMEMNSTFQWLNYIAGFVSTLALVAILRKFTLSFLIVGITTLCFIFSHAFLNFTQTGTSYVTALMFYMLGLLFSLRSQKGQDIAFSILSGANLAISICMWMPFLWVVPAAIAAPFAISRVERKGLISSGWKVASFSIVVILTYLIVLLILQIYSLSELRAWISAASHGNETRGFLRMVFGLSRSFVYMGNDGILIKRFLISDPLNPVAFGALVTGALWKFVLFYCLAGALLFSLVRTADGRRLTAILFLAGLPMLGFAILFDGGAVERYLPLFALAFIGLAVALQSQTIKIVRYGMLTILAVFAFVNLNAFSFWHIAEKQESYVFRIAELVVKADPDDTIFLVNWTDDLINFNRSFPFNEINSRSKLRFNAVVTPGAIQTKQWREEFAARSFKAWRNGKNVWLSSRAFSEKPEADWNWAEGDDKNVSWKEFPQFFGSLERGESVGDKNGFTLIFKSEANKSFLQKYKDKFGKDL